MKEEKEFEELFESFVQMNSELDKRERECGIDCSDNIPLEPYVSRGVAYNVPKARKPEYKFERVMVKNELEKMSVQEASFSMLIQSNRYHQSIMYVQFESLRLIDTKMRYEADGIVILAYKVGNPNPMFICRKKAEDISDSMVINLSQYHNKWQPGDYFLLITNTECEEEEMRGADVDEMHSHIRYSFRLLENGAMLEHPVITSFSLSSERFVEIGLEGATGSLNKYRLLMYSSTWVKLSDVDGLYAHKGILRMKLFSALYWTDGDYSLVLVHNGEPCMKCSLSWKDWKLENYSWEKLDVDSPYYMLSKYMLDNDYWERLCRIPGTSQIRKAIIENYGCQVLNDWRKVQDMNWIVRNMHLSLVVPDGKYDEELGFCCAELLNTSTSYKNGNCERLVESKNTFDPLADMRELLDECVDSVVCLHHLSALVANPNGKLLLNLLEEKLQTEERWGLILMGTASEIRSVMEVSAVVSRYIPLENRLEVESLSVQEQVHFLQLHLGKMNLKCTIEALRKLSRILMEHREQTVNWGKEDLMWWWKHDIYPRFIQRILVADEVKNPKQMLYLVQEEDWFMKEAAMPKDQFAESVQELNEMVGLASLKQNMITLFNRSRFEQKRRDMGFPVLDKGGYHMIFTGNPGTGKTTVAKLVGKIYHSLGLLSKGGVIVTERTKLVGRYLGETERNMTAVLEQAKGNVLFIDEAYTLCDNDQGDRKDFGCRVLESLLTVLSQKNPDMIVILAGYEKEMNRMLEMNPGMKGRFPYKFCFEDYNEEELFRIASKILERAEYRLTPEAESRLIETIQETVNHKDAFFHNARWVEQYILDGVVSAMSDRLMESPLNWESRELMQTIEVEDIEKAYQKMKPLPSVVLKQRKRIGFVA